MTGRDGAAVDALIPAYDAARWVGDVVARTAPLVRRVLVVDDGSSDATGEAARGAGAEVLAHDVNQGKGAALRTGFSHLFSTGAAAIVTLDADGQHLPEQISGLVAAWNDGADLVIGDRSHLFAGMSRVRRISNTLSSRAIAAAAGLDLADVQSGFRLYTRALIEATGFPEARFDAESAVVVRAARRGFRVVAVPISLAVTDGRSTSHYRAMVDSLRIARSVIRARFERQ